MHQAGSAARAVGPDWTNARRVSGEAEELKRRAAEAAIQYVESGMVLGLGTGSTVAHFLDLLAARLDAGRLSDIVGVPTSVHTERRATELGIELIAIADRPRIDLTVDGADEVDPHVDLIKGAGGALLREKMVAQASERVVIIADASKSVARLGTSSPLPLEVVRWGWESHVSFMRGWGAVVSVRTQRDGEPLESDNGQVFLDCHFEDGIEDPGALEEALRARAGIVETGLFLGLADVALIAGPSGVQIRGRAE